jgi:hypothetical protein
VNGLPIPNHRSDRSDSQPHRIPRLRRQRLPLPSSLPGTVPAFVEMHAVQLAEPNNQHIAKVDGEDDDAAYRAVCMLAESVGIELEDG